MPEYQDTPADLSKILPGWDSVDQKCLEDIQEKGWSGMGVFPTPDDPGVPFNYTIGFTEKDHPEMIIMGMGNDQQHQLLWCAYKAIEEGFTFKADTYSDKIVKGLRVAFLEVLDPLSDDFPMSMTKRFYGEEFTALQMVWPDRDDRFPWHHDFDQDFIDRQKLLGFWHGV